jgi:hypothetical protein
LHSRLCLVCCKDDQDSFQHHMQSRWDFSTNVGSSRFLCMYIRDVDKRSFCRRVWMVVSLLVWLWKVPLLSRVEKSLQNRGIVDEVICHSAKFVHHL